VGKNPCFLFYPNDWSHDLEEHPLEIEGAWIRICCKLWWSETRGLLTRSYEHWARILRVTPEESQRILTYLSTYSICDICVTDHGDVTVTSRRMFREDRERQQAAERKRRQRERESNHADVTIASSVPVPVSVTDTKKKEKKKTLAPTYNFDLHQWDNLNGKMDVWSKAFPAVDITLELNKMAAWLEDNPKNRKSNYSRFINLWLSKSQDRAPRRESASSDKTYSRPWIQPGGENA